MSQDIYWEIRPYVGNEEREALSRIAAHPIIDPISNFLFPGEGSERFRELISSLSGVDEFQSKVMLNAIQTIIKRSTSGLTYSGIDQLRDDKPRLYISNHRDIMLDSAIVQVILFLNNFQTSEMAVGDNLITDSFTEDVARSNKMIKVVRSGTPKELYKSSSLLSQYIREAITSGRSSVWIAQRNGRTKNGIDTTEQGLLKMFDMSGSSNFVKDFNELRITPISISYEYEPCDILKAKELYISKRKKYEKSPGEDLNSILTGLLQNKGGVHVHFCDPISLEELEGCSKNEKNEKFKRLAEMIDSKIRSTFKLWGNNYIAHDTLYSTSEFERFYSKEELMAFNNYCNTLLSNFDGEIEELRDIFLSIYSNPLTVKQGLTGS